MKNRLCAQFMMLILAFAGLTGCAGVKFYSDSTLKTPTGIPIYAPKPYLLVARTGAKDKPVEVSVIYMNDASKVIYAKPESGFGSSNLTLALANGQMTSFGQQTDTKIPELITSLGGLITSRATASKTGAEADAIRAGIETMQSAVSALEVGQKVVELAKSMQAKIDANELRDLTPEEMTTVKSAAHALRQAGESLADPANAPSAKQNLDIVKAQAGALAELPAPTAATPRDAALQLVQAWASELKKMYQSAQPPKAAAPAFELYEIKQENGVTTLHQVL